MIQTDYGEGRLVHFTQARLALSNMQGFQPLAVIGVQGDMIVASTPAGEVIELRCCQAQRLADAIAQQNSPTRPVGDGLYRSGRGWRAAWSRRYHLLVVPSGPSDAAGKVEVLLVFEIENGGVTRTVASDSGVSLHLFNVSVVLEPHNAKSGSG